MTLGILGLEHSKLFRRRLIWIELAAITLLTLLIFALTAPMARMGDGVTSALAASMGWPNGAYEFSTIAGGNSLGGYLGIILVAATIGQEYTWRTLHLWLSRGVGRPRLLLAKFVSILWPLLLLVLASLAAALVGSALVTVVGGGTVVLASLDLGRLLSRAVLTAYTLLPYAAITCFVTVATRSTTAGLGITIAFSLLVEGLLVQLLSLASDGVAKVGQFLPVKLAQGLLYSEAQFVQVRVDSAPLAVQTLDPVPAAGLIAAYALVFLALAVWSFRRQDLTA